MMSDGAVTSFEEGQRLLDLGGDGNSPELQPNLQKVSEGAAADPRSAMMAMLAKRGGGGGGDSSSSGSGGGVVVVEPVQLKNCPKYGKYFKMLKVHASSKYQNNQRNNH